MSPIGKFTLKALIWLPLCFGAWYFLSILFVLPVAAALDGLMSWAFPDLVRAIKPDGNAVSITTQLTALQADLGAAVKADVVFTVNPLIYGYCVPFYTALVLAAPGHDSKTFGYWIIGMLILFLVQLFGLAAEITKVLAFNINDEARERLGFSALGYEGLALVYQFGYLILPVVSPVLIWISQFRHQLPQLIQPVTTTRP